MIYTDGEPTICSVGTEKIAIEKPKPKADRIIIRDLVRIQYADYLHSFNLTTGDFVMKSYYKGKMNACLDILERIEVL